MMIIVDTIQPTRTTVSTLKLGTVFRFNGKIYLRVGLDLNAALQWGPDAKPGGHLVLNMTNDRVEALRSNDEVEVLDGKLVLGGVL